MRNFKFIFHHYIQNCHIVIIDGGFDAAYTQLRKVVKKVTDWDCKDHVGEEIERKVLLSFTPEESQRIKENGKPEFDKLVKEKNCDIHIDILNSYYEAIQQYSHENNQDKKG